MTTLKKVMLINAISSALCGLLLIVDAGMIAEIFAAPVAQPFIWVGAFLIVFALEVYLVGRQHPPNPGLVKVIIALDTTWVAASIMIIAAQLFNLSFVGYAAIALVALWVAAMAYFQYRGLRFAQQA